MVPKRAGTEQRQFVTHNLTAGIGNLVAGILGFALQAAISHRLRPADFGAVFAVLSLINLLALPASAFTRLIAYETSRGLAVAGVRTPASAALLRSANRRLFVTGCAVTLAVAAASPLFGAFLRIPGPYLIAGALALPFMMSNPLVLGELQGEQRVGAWSGIMAGAAFTKLVGAIVIGLIFGPIGVLLGISLGSMIIYLVNYAMVRRHIKSGTGKPNWPAAWQFVAVTVPAMLCVSLLLSLDVLLVKHLFSPAAAGKYSAVAALGRSSYWAMGGVAAVLFPKVAARKALGRRSHRLILASIGLAVGGGLTGLAIFELAGRQVLFAFSGRSYVSAFPLLGPYAIGMTLLGTVLVLVVTHQSMGRARFLAILLPAAPIEALLILAFHSSLMQVVLVVDACMALLVVGLGIVLVIEEKETESLERSNYPALPTPVLEAVPGELDLVQTSADVS